MIAYPLYKPDFQPYFGSATSSVSPIHLMLWLFAEYCNLVCHLTLRNLRPAGTTVRQIPVGFGFDAVSCPN